MKTTWTIFKKELVDTLRDRRTLMMTVVLPILLFPLIMWGMAELRSTQREKGETKTLRVGLVRAGNAARFAEMLEARDDLAVYDAIPADSARAFVRGDSLDAVFTFAADFDRQVAAHRAGQLTFIYESGGDLGVQKERLLALVDASRQQLRTERFAAMGLQPSVIETVDLQEVDVATARETLGRLLGGFLPYVFLMFCFMGAMYPAIDLAAGEKERHTMETLLTSPASRFQIVLGKFGVITLAGILSAVVAIVGQYAGLQLVGGLPEALHTAVQGVLDPGMLLLLLSLLIPLTMFFAGLQLTLSLYAKSFKEAQSILSPLIFIAIIPAVIGLLPGVELTAVTALVPVLNVSLATKAIIAGTAAPGLLVIVYASLVVLAGLSLYLCSVYFRKEDIIFRT